MRLADANDLERRNIEQWCRMHDWGVNAQWNDDSLVGLINITVDRYGNTLVLPKTFAPIDTIDDLKAWAG